MAVASGLSITGNFTSNGDGVFDIGLVGGSRFRDLFLTRNAVVSGLVQANGGLQLGGAATLGAAAFGLFDIEGGTRMRYFVGDGTGYEMNFSKRVGGVTSDLIRITDVGILEMFANGSTIVMHSANGSRWAMSVSNAGALVIAAA
jgi:hypothetical protein